MRILLHGFWGQPADWNEVIAQLPLGLEVHAPDLYAPGKLSPHHALGEWTRNFWNWVDATLGVEEVDLVGYSMGARLTLAATLAWPQRVRRALHLSGNPVLTKEAASERAMWETEWSENFLKLDWPELETAWQDQSVFANTPTLPRRKTPEMREILGLSLENWSPRLHPWKAEDLKSLGAGVEWAFGALDQKYVEVAKRLQDLGVKGQITLVPGCGHRLITEAAGFVADWIVRGDA